MLQILRTADFDVWLAEMRDKAGQKQVLARLARLSLGHWATASRLAVMLSNFAYTAAQAIASIAGKMA